METTNDHFKTYRIWADKWHYIALTFLFALGAASLFLYLSRPLYRSDASLKLEERKSELTELLSIRNLYDRSSKSISEKQIICSRNVLNKAIASLNYKVAFYIDKGFHRPNVYPFRPLEVQIIQTRSDLSNKYVFRFEALNSKTFRLSYAINHQIQNRKFAYGTEIRLPGLAFCIRSMHHTAVTPCYFKFNDNIDLLDYIQKNLKIEDDQNTNILKLYFTDPNAHFAKDVLNAILREYQKYDHSQRSLSIKQTSVFIDTLIKKMSGLLSASAMSIKKFKTTHQLFSISSQTSHLIDRIALLEVEKHQLLIKKLVLSELFKNLLTGKEQLNYNLQGIENPQLTSLLQSYNTLLQRKMGLLIASQSANPIIIALNDQLNQIKQAIQDNLIHQQQENNKILSQNLSQTDTLKKNINTFPETERSYIRLQSEFEVNQKVYNYLSEKRLEAKISTAAVTSGIQVIDYAILPAEAIYPVKTEIYTDFGVCGILTSFIAIFLHSKFNSRLYATSQIETLSSIPILGYIRHYPQKKGVFSLPSTDDPKSLFSESIRALRINLNYIQSEKASKLICITSADSGEGKSFIAANLASALTLIDKKVCLVCSDLRKSTLHTFLGLSNRHGLSSYLAGQSTLIQICQKTSVNNLIIIPSGPVPPNPAELIQNTRMNGLLTALKKSYDYVLLDCAPAGLVSDTIPLLKQSDINLFVLRHSISRKYSAMQPKKLLEEFNLPNISLVLNGFEKDRFDHSYYHLPDSYRNYNQNNEKEI